MASPPLPHEHGTHLAEGDGEHLDLHAVAGQAPSDLRQATGKLDIAALETQSVEKALPQVLDK